MSGADREGLASVRAPFPPSACVRNAQGGDVGQGGSAQPYLPAVLGLHVAARDAAALVLRVQPEVCLTLHAPIRSQGGWFTGSVVFAFAPRASCIVYQSTPVFGSSVADRDACMCTSCEGEVKTFYVHTIGPTPAGA